MSKPKRSIDAWGIGFVFIHNARREPMTRAQAALIAFAVAAVVGVIAEGVITWPL
jgi:hypothetical protein